MKGGCLEFSPWLDYRFFDLSDKSDFFILVNLNFFFFMKTALVPVISISLRIGKKDYYKFTTVFFSSLMYHTVIRL